MDINESVGVVEREAQGIAIPIRNQFGKPAVDADGTTPAMMTVVGSYSKRHRDAIQAYRAWIAEQDGEIDPDVRDAKWIELVLAKSILGWTGLTSGTAPFPFTEANAIALLTPRPWIREDVEKALGKHEAFFDERSTLSRVA